MIMLKPELSGYKLPKFTPGDLVRHVRYHYRGVVVAHDPKCMAGEDWYQSNQTQPEKDQPWYHVLIHGSESITYPADPDAAIFCFSYLPGLIAFWQKPFRGN